MEFFPLFLYIYFFLQLSWNTRETLASSAVTKVNPGRKVVSFISCLNSYSKSVIHLVMIQSREVLCLGIGETGMEE